VRGESVSDGPEMALPAAFPHAQVHAALRARVQSGCSSSVHPVVGPGRRGRRGRRGKKRNRRNRRKRRKRRGREIRGQRVHGLEPLVDLSHFAVVVRHDILLGHPFEVVRVEKKRTGKKQIKKQIKIQIKKQIKIQIKKHIKKQIKT
jgi:hypothetical protein